MIKWFRLGLVFVQLRLPHLCTFGSLYSGKNISVTVSVCFPCEGSTHQVPGVFGLQACV